ncbi:uncharacterized protein AAHN32_008735 [Aegotheles albertisi]
MGFVPLPSPGAVWPGLQRSPAWGEARKLSLGGLWGPGATWGLLLCGSWLLAAGYLASATGGCWHQCCPGRNNACWAPGTRWARCYCDLYCERRTGEFCEEVAKILPDSFSQDFRDPWRRAGLLLPEEPSG